MKNEGKKDIGKERQRNKAKKEIEKKQIRNR
jgi:hypothetical protein